MSSTWWGSSSSSSPQSWDDERRGGHWQQESHESAAGKKDKEKDRFKNVTSLGAASKHPLPLEDRKALLVAVVHLLSPNKIMLSKIAVSTFTATTTHALLFLLSRAGLRMSIRLLRDEDGVFTIDFAAQQLAETALSLHQPEALADPRWVPGAPGFRFGAVLVQVLVRSEFIFGSHLVQT